MRVALLTALESFDDAYSVKRVIVDQAKMLAAAGHDVVLYVKQGFHSTYGTLPCIATVQLPGYMHGDHERTRREFVERFGGDELTSYDAILEHDLYFLDQHKGYRMGIRDIASRTKAKWFHWTHSVPRPIMDAKGMEGHVYISLCHESVPTVAEMYSIPEDQVEVCYNPSDITDVLSPETAALVEETNLLDCDILGVLPFSIGRLKQKGIQLAAAYYAGIGKHGDRVKVLLCASRTTRNQAEVDRWDQEFAQLGPSRCEFLWMNRLRPQWSEFAPNRVVRELLGLSNLFIWPTIGEACSLAIAEARTSGGPFCVLPESRVAGMREFSDEDAYLCYWQEGHWQRKVFRQPDDVAKEILARCDLDRYRRRLCRQYAWSRRGIWEQQLKPLLERRCPGAW